MGGFGRYHHDSLRPKGVRVSSPASFERPWTAAEKRRLEQAYTKGGIHAAKVALPDRGESGIYHMTQRLGLKRRRRWTTDDDERLRAQWGLEDIYTIARNLGRTRLTVYWRAYELDLPLGCPEGWEYLSDAAARAGFATATLWRILRFSRVRVLHAYARNQGRRHTHIVEPLDVDDAVAAWMQTETLTEAARRLDVNPESLHRWCETAGVILHRDGRIKRSRMRADSTDFDRAVSEHRQRQEQSVSLTQASRELGVHRQTLAGWVRAAGFERGAHFDRIDRDLLRKVVDEHQDEIRKRERAA